MSNSPRQHLRDEEIAGAVRRALAHDPLLGQDDLTVTVQDGVVQLRGMVESATERAAAERDARVSGVTHVDNGLTVVASEATDRNLESAVEASLAQRPTLARKVAGQVRNGRAILTGKVEDLAAAQEAIRAAEAVPGVFAVEDEIEVTAPGRVAPFDIDDATLHGEVALALDNALLDIVGRELTVENGDVTIRGLAPDGQGARAEMVAAGVPGVRHILNEIRLLQSEQSSDPDEALEARVLRALGANGHTSIATLSVIARDGHVTISGPVGSIEGQDAITRIASSVPGVRNLDNRTVLTDVTSVRSGDKGVHHRRGAP